MQILDINTLTDCVGYVASGLVLATFCFSSPTRLRLAALASNLAFMTFGYLGDIYPVMALHAVLFPINLVHLTRLLGSPLSVSHSVPEARLGSARVSSPPQDRLRGQQLSRPVAAIPTPAAEIKRMASYEPRLLHAASAPDADLSHSALTSAKLRPSPSRIASLPVSACQRSMATST